MEYTGAMAYPIARRSVLPFVRFFARSVDGVDRIPTDRPVIVAANHLGLFDPLFVGAVYVGMTKRKLRFLVDTRNVFWKTIGITLNYWTNAIPIRPGRQHDAIRAAVAALGRGDAIGVFPEGRVNTSPTLLEGRTGAVRMALLAGCEILPVGIERTNASFWSIIGRRLTNRREGIAMRIGSPIRLSGDPGDEVTVRRLTDDLMQRIAQLSQKPYPA